MRHATSLLIAVMLAAALCGLLEWRARATGTRPSVNPSSDMALWAHHRKALSNDPRALAILGTSRVLFDIDLAVLARETGRTNLRQLGIVGTNAFATLEDLAADVEFSGDVLVDINEESLAPPNWDSQRAYGDRRSAHFTLPERWGALVRAGIEEKLAFLNPALSNLNRIKWVSFGITDVRTQMSAMRTLGCVAGHEMPMEWNLAAAQSAIPAARTALATTLPAQIERLRGIVARLQARGSSVVFFRPPLAPELEDIYAEHLPRREFWEPVADRIGAPALRADDFPELASFVPPDGSHLCQADAAEFTRRLAGILRARRWLQPR
jgi:hypothetical protein